MLSLPNIDPGDTFHLENFDQKQKAESKKAESKKAEKRSS
jgi:hypothetical protein